MKKMRILQVVLCCILLLQCCIVPGSALGNAPTEDESISSGCHTVDAKSSVLGDTKLIENADSAILYDMNSNTMIYSWNADERIDPASLVKIMTAWVAIENGNLSEVVEIRNDVLATVPSDAVSQNLKSSEIFTLEELLYCMMVSSANDAAAVIADHVGGSQMGFVALMNQYAEKVGCTDTNFTNAHGLSDTNQYSTARDVTKILNGAMRNEEFRKFFGATYYAIENSDGSYKRVLTSKNYLMNADSFYYDPRVKGSRTGVASNRKRCVASTAKDGNLEVICIISGAKSEYEEDGYTERTFGGFGETTKLLDLGLTGYRRAQVIYDGQIFKQSPVVNGESDVLLGSSIAVSTVIPANVKDSDLTYRFYHKAEEFKAPIDKGDKLSCVQILYNGVCLAQADLYAMNSVPVMQAKVYKSEPNNWNRTLLGIVITVVLGLLAVGAVVFLVLRTKNGIKRAAIKGKSRRNRMNRRRSR